MTETLFHTDSSVREFEATVTAVDVGARTVILDRTAFFPGGGGQPHDRGTLRTGATTLSVLRVGWSAAGVSHTVEGDLPEIGSAVVGKLDWTRRHALMRTHTALHILCGVVWRDYGAQVTGGNMKPLQGRLDFEFEHLHADLIAEIEAKVNAEVECAREIRVAVLPRAEAFQIPDLIRTKVNLLPASLEQIRTIEIVGLDLQADGGTHVGNTIEVGPIAIAGYESKGRINKRIRIALAPA